MTTPHSLPTPSQLTRVNTMALMLVSDKESSLHTSCDDSQGVMTRKIIDQGKIEETAVPATINAKEIMLNGESLLKEKLSNENILQVISSENKLTHEQLIQVEAVLNSQEWYNESTSMTALGQIIVVAIVTVITMGSGSAVAAGGTTGATTTVSAGTAIVGSIEGITAGSITGTAVAASIDAMIINIGTQLLSGAITGELDLDLEAALKSAVLAGAFSAATNIIDANVFPQGVNNYGQKIAREILHGLAKKAIYGGDIKAILAESAGNVAFDYIAHDVYSSESKFPAIRDNIPKDVIHGLVGGALSELGGGDFSSGAVATVVSHVVAEQIGDGFLYDAANGNISKENAMDQLQALTSIVSATIVLATHEDVSDEELAIAQSMGESVVEYNYLQTFEQKLDFLQGLASKLGDLSIEMIEGLMALANMPPQEFDETIKLLLPEGLSKDEAEALNEKLITLTVVFDENTLFEGDAYSAGEDLGDVTSAILVVGGIGKLKKLKKLEKVKTTNKVEYITKKRKTLGSDGASSEHIIEKIDGKTNSTTHKVTKDGQIIHQHQDHVGKYGTKERFPDSWTGTETINAK